MKTLKDKFVSDNLWYLVLAYMHDTVFKDGKFYNRQSFPQIRKRLQ